jgi:hypothetical protein
MKITIADYISIKNYNTLRNKLNVEDIELLKESILLFSNVEEQELNKWSDTTIASVGNKIYNNFTEQESNIFYPLLEIDSQVYGYITLENMTLGEFIDLDILCQNNAFKIEEIMAILYRPIQETIKQPKYNKKWGIKFITNPIEYTATPYTTKVRKTNTSVMEELPINFAKTALNIFLNKRSQLLANFEGLFKQSEEDEQTESKGVQWSWFSTLHYLASTDILKVNGEQSITDLNVSFVFNWMAYDKWVADEQRKKTNNDALRRHSKNI